jgi:hypothetical protein
VTPALLRVAVKAALTILASLALIATGHHLWTTTPKEISND